MATPSSSATSPSPPMLKMIPQQTIVARSLIPQSNDHNNAPLQKFIARAEISTVTRALRARLSYASYKAAHNVSHVSLGDLEARSLQSAVTNSPSRPSKRKAAGGNHYANSPGQGNAAADRKSSMAPPNSYPSTSKGNHLVGGGVNAHGITASDILRQPVNNLYTSLLAPPPSKQARTIHNASDPPISSTSQSTRRSKPNAAARSIAEGTRSQAKNRQQATATKTGGARKEKRVKKGKTKAADRDVRADGDVDMEAAATLASFLSRSRPSVGGSASSPRSSISSESASLHSYSHFAQSSTRTLTGARNEGSLSSISNVSNAPLDPTSVHRRLTPPPPSEVPSQVTPRQASDSEAADLMLYLATSPSPVRPATTRDKDAADRAAFEALSGASRAGLREKGRVLFPSAPSTGDGVRVGNRSHAPVPDEINRRQQHMARTGALRSIPGDSSFASSISSIGSEMRSTDSTSESTVKASTPHQYLHPSSATHQPSSLSYLLPQSLPISRTGSGSTVDGDVDRRPSTTLPTHPPTPTPMNTLAPGVAASPFDFGEFINVSPSPRIDPQASASGNGALKNGLRENIGRKLFEEEQTKQHPGVTSIGSIQPSSQELGAGINLIRG